MSRSVAAITARDQKILLWWGIGLNAIWWVALRFNFHMFPPPTARWSAAQIAQFYTEHGTEVKIGATLASWTSGGLIPIFVVIILQMYRHEKGRLPVWTVLGAAGGVLFTIFQVLPGIFWGVAAFTASRAPDATAIMHELGTLTFMSTDQYYIFAWVAIAVICLRPSTVKHSPFPRWFGYLTIFAAVLFEFASCSYIFRSGPLAWNGLLVFWLPVLQFAIWGACMFVLMFKALNRQAAEEDAVATSPVAAV